MLIYLRGWNPHLSFRFVNSLTNVFSNFLQPDDEAVDLNKALMEKLLELDDVDAVYSNQV